MGFPFSRRVSLIPGVRVNFTQSGASLSVSSRGAKLALINFFRRQTYLFRAKKILRVAGRPVADEAIGGKTNPLPPPT
jgi:Protein of unknown function (DUF4236)